MLIILKTAICTSISFVHALFGLMVSSGMEWNGVGYIYVLLFGFTKSEWNEME